MEATVIIIFVIGYLLIAFEHPIKVNKSATAIVTGVLCWTIYALFSEQPIEHIIESISRAFWRDFRNFIFPIGCDDHR